MHKSSDLKFVVGISNVFNGVNEIKKSYNEAQSALDCQVTNRIIDYLNENYERKISSQEIADIVSLSPTHLSTIIKKDTGESYIDLFNNIKVGGF